LRETQHAPGEEEREEDDARGRDQRGGGGQDVRDDRGQADGRQQLPRADHVAERQAGIWNTVYVNRKAVMTQPICTWDRPNSGMIHSATTEMPDRYTYPVNADVKSIAKMRGRMRGLDIAP